MVFSAHIKIGNFIIIVVAGLTPARALLHNNLKQVVHTLVSLLLSSVSWYRCKTRKVSTTLYHTLP